MLLSEILRPEAVKVLHSASSKKRLFHELGDLAERCFDLSAAAVTHALQEREALGPTGVGHGVALPHARMTSISAVHGLFVRLDKPIEFEAVDRQPVDLVFMLLAPEDSGVEHLRALAMVSRTMRSSDNCAKLRANSNESALHAILTEMQGIQAA